MADDGKDAVASGAGDDQVTKAVKSMRETAKWLVAIFGALGAALIGTLSLADLGSLQGSAREWALVGFFLAIAGIVIVIGATSSVLTPQEVSIGDLEVEPLRSYVDDRPALRRGFDSLDDVVTTYADAGHDRVVANRRVFEIYYRGEPDGAEHDEYEEQLNARKEAERLLELVNPAIDDLLAAGTWERVRRRFARVAVPGIFVGVAIAAVGAAVFAAQVSKPESDAPPAVAAAPSRVVMSIDRDVRSTYRELAGRDCDLRAVRAIVLEASDDHWTTVFDDDRCSVVRLDVRRSDAQVRALALTCTPGPRWPERQSAWRERRC